MKNVLVTGSSRGIGNAIFDLLEKSEGIEVIGTSTSGSKASNNREFLQLDLSDSHSIRNFISEPPFSNVDLLINNAGKLLEDWDNSEVNMEQLKMTFSVNVFGTIELTERLLPIMKNGSHIINVSSNWGSFSDPKFDEFQPHYKMSKASLNMYSRLLAERVRDRNIIVSAFDPGWTKTDMGGSNANRSALEVAHELLNFIKSPVKTGKFWHRGKVREW